MGKLKCTTRRKYWLFGPKEYILEGKLLDFDTTSFNGYVYSRECIVSAVENLKDKAECKRLYGTYLSDASSDSTTDLRLSSITHQIYGLKTDDYGLRGKMKILDTPDGRCIKKMLDANVPMHSVFVGWANDKTIESIIRFDLTIK